MFLRHEPVHVDVAELSQLPSELLSQDGVGAGGEISESVLHRQPLLVLGQAVGSVGSMSYLGVSGPGGREGTGLQPGQQTLDGGGGRGEPQHGDGGRLCLGHFLLQTVGSLSESVQDWKGLG